MATRTISNAGGNWDSVGSWVEGAVPTSADDVVATGTSGNLTLNVTAACRSINLTNYVGVLTHNNGINLNIGDGTAGAGNIALKFVAGMTYTPVTSACTVRLISTSATQQTVDPGGKSFSIFVVTGVGASYLLSSTMAVSSTGTFQLNAGIWNTNGQTMNVGTVNINDTSTAELTLGASIINATFWNMAALTTFNAGTSSIRLTGTATFNGGGRTYNELQLNGTSHALNGANTFATLTRTGTATKTDSLTIGANQTITGTLTINGNSTVNRLLVQSDVLGTPRTLTAGTVSVTRADFMDITGAGAGSWNLSAITGGSGDCGGNSGITFTTAADQHWLNASSGSWSTAANWTSRVPLPQDNVFMDKAFGTSQAVTSDMPRLGKNIDWTGATWTTALTWTTSVSCRNFGSLTLISGLTTSGAGLFTFHGRANCTFTTHGVTIVFPLGITVIGATLTQQGNLTCTSSSLFLLSGGTWDANNFNVTFRGINGNSGSSLNDRDIVMGSGTWTVTGSGAAWNMGTGTVTAGTSTIKYTDTTNNSASFSGGGLVYNNIWFDRGASTGSITITSGSNTFNDFKDDGTAAHSILFGAGTTTTVNTFNVTGASGAVITINSNTTATHNLVKSTGGNISCDWLNIQHSVASPASTWYAGTNSTNNQGVATAGSGWLFTAPPAEITVTFTTDALLQAVNELVHQTDAMLKGDRTVSHSTDALILEGECALYDSDLTYDNAEMYICPPGIESHTLSHTVDALLQAIFIKTHSTDALLQDTFVVVHSTDAYLYLENELDHSTDALLRDTATRQHTVDALLRATFLRAHSTDALLQEVSEVVHTTDAYLRATELLQHNTDALLRAAFILAHSTDAQLLSQGTIVHTTDAYLVFPPQYGTLLTERGVIARNAIENRAVIGINFVDNRNVEASNTISNRNVSAQNAIPSRSVIAKNSLSSRSVSTS